MNDRDPLNDQEDIRRRLHDVLFHRDILPPHPMGEMDELERERKERRRRQNARAAQDFRYRLQGNRAFPPRAPLSALRKRTEPCVERIRVDEDVLW